MPPDEGQLQAEITAPTLLVLEAGLRLIRGSVSNAGVRVGGAGFSVVRLSTGDYRITWTTPFSADPSVVVSPVSGHVSGRIAQPYNRGPVGTTIRVYNLSNLDRDEFFDFIAIGPA